MKCLSIPGSSTSTVTSVGSLDQPFYRCTEDSIRAHEREVHRGSRPSVSPGYRLAQGAADVRQQLIGRVVHSFFAPSSPLLWETVIRMVQPIVRRVRFALFRPGVNQQNSSACSKSRANRASPRHRRKSGYHRSVIRAPASSSGVSPSVSWSSDGRPAFPCPRETAFFPIRDEQKIECARLPSRSSL